MNRCLEQCWLWKRTSVSIQICNNTCVVQKICDRGINEDELQCMSSY